MLLESLSDGHFDVECGMEVICVANTDAVSCSDVDTLHDVSMNELGGASIEQIAKALAAYETRLDSIGLIVGGIAHDINNLLLVIGGFSGLLKRTTGQEDLVSTAAGGLGEAVRQMSSLTRILSSLASQRTVTFEAINVNAVLASMEQTIAHLLGEGIAIEVRHDPLDGVIRGVRGQLERVLLNLVLNAREAMFKTGRLTMESRSVRIDGRNPHRQLAAGDYVAITVADTGCGMTSATIQKIFDPLFTTKNALEGCGYGLTTVRRIVQDCRGEIFVDSEVGKGSRFEIFLPRAQDQ